MRSTRSTCCSRPAGRPQLLFAQYDALLLPAAPFCPTLAEVAADPLGPNRRLGTFTNFANLCDMAGFAVPIGFARTACRSAACCSVPPGPRGGWRRWPTRCIAGSPPPWARPASRCRRPPNPMRWRRTRPRCSASARTWPGLPLNRQITVAGRPLPARGADRSRAIACSRWATGRAWCAPPAAPRSPARSGRLPTAAIGALLAQVPPPLGFGTVALDDGPCLGFLAESRASRTRPTSRILAAGAPGCDRNPEADDGRSGASTP